CARLGNGNYYFDYW
nr:immunoglobulin heavy chain junction region [Mus musculus]